MTGSEAAFLLEEELGAGRKDNGQGSGRQSGDHRQDDRH
jgi:hypothetical protein